MREGKTIFIKRVTSLTSREMCRESQNASMTKTYSVGCFIHDAELLSHSGDILCKILKQSDWQREFLGQNLV